MIDLLRVYSHPRSGTNLLMRFIAINFYPQLYNDGDLETMGRIGHFKDRVRGQLNPSGKLAGTHHFMHYQGQGGYKNKIVHPCCYLYRDGRAVAYSMWKTKGFQDPEWREWCLSRYLRQPLDWWGSPGNTEPYNKPIAKHWHDHLESWADCEAEHILKVRFEDLVTNPRKVRDRIATWYDLQPVRGLKLVKELVGWLPNDGKIDSWREHFTDEDLEEFYKLAGKPGDFWGYYEATV